MVMSMAVSVHASATDWILTDGLINSAPPIKINGLNSITDGHLQFFTPVSSLLFETFYFLKLHRQKGKFSFLF